MSVYHEDLQQKEFQPIIFWVFLIQNKIQYMANGFPQETSEAERSEFKLLPV